jgi:ubiquinone/menaquinone biosynthesis C-methylase UbiE
MDKVAYAKSAKWYDIVIEPLVRTLRVTGLTMLPPRQGMSVLDIGCGTGSHLDLYQKAGCKTVGIDLSPTMLNVARKKLDALTLGDASRIPFPDESFDLVTATLIFHEMPAALRSPVIGEAKRVVKKSGRLFITDYHPRTTRSLEGWYSKAFITCIEFLAGGEHYRNYRDFMANAGLAPLITENGLLVDKQMTVYGGTIGLYLLCANHTE